MLMFIVSNLAGSTIQITTLPLPVLSTLQAVRANYYSTIAISRLFLVQSGLVFNSICATLILGEPFTRWSLGGTILVCVGAVLIAIFGAIGEPAHNLDQLLQLLGRRQFVTWMIAQAVLVIAIIVSAKTLKYMNPWTSNSMRIRLFRGMGYGAVSGILSAHSLLVAKSAVELLVRTIVDRHNEFNRWQSWIILLGLLSLALTQLYFLHRGLKLCSTSILYPFVFCMYNIIAILDGLIYFDQSSRLSVTHALLVRTPWTSSQPLILSQIALGTVILLLGVLSLSWRLSDEPTTRPTATQNPLTPGMGFVGDSSDSEDEISTAASYIDEEATGANGEETDSLVHHCRTPHSSTSNEPRTPTSKNNDLFSITRLRRPGITESEEIWDELEDDSLADLSPFSHRRSSVLSSRDQTLVDEDAPTESTVLLSRTGTGRSYRDHRRRRSVPVLDSGAMERRRRSVSSQEALGGWWKMKWWKERNEKGKGVGNGNRGGRPDSA